MCLKYPQVTTLPRLGVCFENVSVGFDFVVVVVVIADCGCKNKGSLIEVL
jgi:hypothetical protein